MKLGKFIVKKSLIDIYIKHLNTKDKSDIQKFENERKRLHELIFDSLNLNRHSMEAREFGQTLDSYCAIFVTCPIIRVSMRISACKNEKEMKHEVAMFDFANNYVRKQKILKKKYFEAKRKEKIALDEFSKLGKKRLNND